MSYVGAILGQLPMKSLNEEVFKFSLLSPWGVWCMMVFLANVIMAQSVYATLIILTPVPTPGTAVFTPFDQEAIRFVGISHAIHIQSIYIAFLCSLPKFLITWKKMLSYEGKNGPTPLGIWKLLFTILFSGIWWGETYLGLSSVQNTLLAIKTEPEGLKNFKEASWVYGKFGLEIDIDFFVRRLMSAHICICQISNGFAIQYILLMSYWLAQRLSDVEDGIWTGKRVGRGSDSAVVSWMGLNTKDKRFRNIPPSIDTDDIISKVSELGEIFKVLRAACSSIVLLAMGTGTICCTILVFCTLSFMRFWDTGYFFPMAMLLIPYLIINILKLLWLSNCGEYLVERVSCLQNGKIKMIVLLSIKFCIYSFYL
jgi:hypothetical protein